LQQQQRDTSKLQELTSDNAVQQRALGRLQPLLDTHLELFARQIGPGATEMSRVTESERLLQQITDQIQSMKSTEESLLKVRLAAAAQGSAATKVIIVSGYAVALVLLVVAGMAILNEFAKRTEFELKLRSAEERYHILFDSNPLPLWVFNVKNLEILNVNGAAVSHYGYSREEFLRFKITDIRPLEDIPALLESTARAGNEPESSGPWRHIKKSGEIIYADVTSHPLVYEGKESRLVVAMDVTKRKHAEEALRRSEEIFRLLLSGVRDYAILMLDTEGYVISWNNGAEQIKGYKAEEIVGRHFSRFYPPDEIRAEKPARSLKMAMEQGRFEEEGWRVRKDGTQFWADVVLTAVRDDQGYLRGFGKVTRDISERRRTQEKLTRRSVELEAANKELEAFSYSVSHDLRAPLRAIDGFSQAILEDYADKLDDTGRNFLQRVIGATKRMGTLIDDLLNLSRYTRVDMRREKIELSNLAEIIANELHSADPDRQVAVVVAPGLRAHGDPQLIRVVLENLIGNSWKFTSKAESARIDFGKLDIAGEQAFYVKDNGAGFDMEHAGRLFGAFQRLHDTTEFAGTGIGLATVQRIINRHGGRVWAEGQVGKGATIYFTI
jgi:PAS domain S-box-containing protein